MRSWIFEFKDMSGCCQVCLEVCGKEWSILEASGRKHVEGSE